VRGEFFATMKAWLGNYFGDTFTSVT
jgi:hypothetical protein